LTPQAPGLWLGTYQAPTEAGADTLELSVADEPEAGTAWLPLRVTPGPPTSVTIETPPGPHAPGSVVNGLVTLRDSFGNPALGQAPRVRSGATELVVTPQDVRFGFALTLPRLVPKSGAVLVDARTDFAEAKALVPLRAGPAERVEVTVVPHATTADVSIAATDGFGNVVREPDFTVRAQGGQVAPLSWQDERLRTVFTAQRGVRQGEITVESSAAVLAQARFELEPPEPGLTLVLGAATGVANNGAALWGPRFGASVGLQRRFGPAELGLSVGAEFFLASNTGAVRAGEQDFAWRQSIELLTFPVLLRTRFAVAWRLGAAVGVTVAPAYARVVVLGGPPEATFVGAAGDGAGMALRGHAALDLALGPGRVVLGFFAGHFFYSSRAAVGSPERLALLLGYDWAVWPTGI
jgi:hypothetical protein